MSFLSHPVLEVADAESEWILKAPLVYQAQPDDVFCDVLIVPRGFVTDLASIPRALYAVIPVNGKHRSAAILHDWLYETQCLTRAQCDLVFLHAMEDCGVRWSLRWAMYLGVRAGGWWPWSRRTVSPASRPS